MVKVDNGDSCTNPVCVGNEIGVHTGFGVSKVGAGSDEGGERDVGGGYGSAEGMVRLEGVVPRLRGAIFRVEKMSTAMVVRTCMLEVGRVVHCL